MFRQPAHGHQTLDLAGPGLSAERTLVSEGNIIHFSVICEKIEHPVHSIPQSTPHPPLFFPPTVVLCCLYLNSKQYDRLPINVLFQNVFHIWDHHGKDSLGKHTSFADINLRDGVAKSWCVCVYVHVFA